MNDINKESPLILVVEDEPDLADLLKDYLEAAHYSVKVIGDGLEADTWLENNAPHLILLDLMLPGKDGLEICRDLRKRSSIPVIMVTAKVEEIDRLLGLELGADDYICKPYSPREVVARVKAVLRRLAQPATEESHSTSSISLDEKSFSVTVNGTAIGLTSIEFRLFSLLFSEPGKIFSRQFIMDNIYTDYRIVSDRTVDSHIKKLRKKLQEMAPEDELIRSVYGAGYKYEPPS